MVRSGPSTTVSRPTSPAQALPSPPPEPLARTSPGPETCASGPAIIRCALQKHLVSPEVAQFIVGSWRDSTHRQYGAHLQRWVSFCVSREIDPFLPPLNALLQFLYDAFHHGRQDTKGLGYSSINTIRSAISSIATINGQPAGQHPLVRRFLKSVFNQRPSLPRYTTTWDPNLVLEHIKTLGPNKRLSILQLSRKLAMLMLLLSGQRGQTLHLLDTRNMQLSPNKASFQIGDLLKTSRPGVHMSELVFKAYAPDRRLCVHTALTSYLGRTLDNRGTVTRLFLTTKPPFRPASRDTIRRWIRQIMSSAGIDTNMFAPHSVRAAAASKAATTLPLMTIVQAIGWSSSSTFSVYYKKPLAPQGSIASAILGNH